MPVPCPCVPAEPHCATEATDLVAEAHCLLSALAIGAPSALAFDASQALVTHTPLHTIPHTIYTLPHSALPAFPQRSPTGALSLSLFPHLSLSRWQPILPQRPLPLPSGSSSAATALGSPAITNARRTAPTSRTSLGCAMPLMKMRSWMARASLRSFTTKVASARVLQPNSEACMLVSSTNRSISVGSFTYITSTTTRCCRLRGQRKHPLSLQLPREQLHRWR